MRVVALILACAVSVTAGSRGEKVFQKNCAKCHYASDRRKVGPGMKGLFHRATLEENGEPVNETNVRRLIENGAGAGEMPPFKGKIKGSAMKALLDYLKRL